MAKAVNAGYNRFSVFLHWFCAFLLIVMFVSYPGGEQSTLHKLHLLGGPVTGLLFLVWIAYRLKRGLPKNEEGNKSIANIAAIVTVWAFHLTIITLLVSGILLPWVQGNPINLLGVKLASPIFIDPLHLGTIKSIHSVTAYLLAPLLVVHIIFSRNLEHMFSVESGGY